MFAPRAKYVEYLRTTEEKSRYFFIVAEHSSCFAVPAPENQIPLVPAARRVCVCASVCVSLTQNVHTHTHTHERARTNVHASYFRFHLANAYTDAIDTHKHIHTQRPRCVVVVDAVVCLCV